MTTDTPGPDGLAHHPHWLRTETTEDGRTQWWFREFTGDELAIAAPEGASAELRGEYTAAWRLIQEADRRRDVEAWYREVRPLIRAAAPAWQALQRARKEVDAIYEGLRETADGSWYATVMRLLDAHRVLEAAAADWDRATRPIAQTIDTAGVYVVYEDADGLRGAAQALGIDIQGWDIASVSSYDSWSGTPMAQNVRRLIEEQRERLAEHARLTGTPTGALVDNNDPRMLGH